jgi:peptidoglycan/LPS O-acetylase OafA/YrhL
MQPGRRFFATLDGIRGIAAIMVVELHAHALFSSRVSEEGFLAVDIFFILSGVVITNAYEHRLCTGLTFQDFMKIRLIRLYPLYLLGTLIGIFSVIYSIESIDHVKNNYIYMVVGVFMLPNLLSYGLYPLNPPAWSLFFEIFANAVHALIFRFLNLRNLAAIMALSASGLAGILYFVHVANFNIGWTATNTPGGFFRVGYSYFAGVLLYRLYESRKPVAGQARRVMSVPWIILGVVAATLAAKPSAEVRPYYELAVILLVFPAIVYCALFFEPVGIGAKLCKFLGAISYAVYVIHMPLYWVFQYTITRVTAVPLESLAPWAGFCFIGILLPLCWVLDKFYDGPLRSFLSARGQVNLSAAPKKPVS